MKFKKVISSLLVVSMVGMLGACGKTEDKSNTTSSDNTKTTTEDKTEEKTESHLKSSMLQLTIKESKLDGLQRS